MTSDFHNSLKFVLSTVLFMTTTSNMSFLKTHTILISLERLAARFYFQSYSRMNEPSVLLSAFYLYFHKVSINFE